MRGVCLLLVSGFAHTLLSAFVYTCVAAAVGALISEVRIAVEMNQRVDPGLRAQDCPSCRVQEIWAKRGRLNVAIPCSLPFHVFRLLSKDLFRHLWIDFGLGSLLFFARRCI